MGDVSAFGYMAFGVLLAIFVAVLALVLVAAAALALLSAAARVFWFCVAPSELTPPDTTPQVAPSELTPPDTTPRAAGSGPLVLIGLLLGAVAVGWLSGTPWLSLLGVLPGAYVGHLITLQIEKH